MCLRCAVKQVRSREKNSRGWSGFKLVRLIASVGVSVPLECPSGDSDSLHDQCSLVPRLFVETEIRPRRVRLVGPDSRTLVLQDHGYMVVFEGEEIYL